MADMPGTRPSLLMRLRDAADASAWAEFVDLYGPVIYRYGTRQGLQDADAADLTQEVLGRLARVFKTWKLDPARGSFRSWFFTVVRNALNTLRSRDGRPGRGSGDTGAHEQLGAQPAPTEDVAWDQEYRRRLFAWAAEQVRPIVEPSAWQAFWLTGVEGRSAKETAEGLGMTVAAVYMAKSRVLSRIREQISVVEGGEEIR